MAVSPYRILLVEDEEADIVHFQRLTRQHGLAVGIDVARNGDAALEILRRTARDGRRHVVVTDLNMPGLTGHEFIGEIRSDNEIAGHVIFVVSTSDLPDDINKAYEHHVAGYIVKDAHGQRLSEGVAMLGHYLKAVSISER